MRFHEARGDKIIIFSDTVFALRAYAKKLERPWIDGAVQQNERMRVLTDFKMGGRYQTVLISKVGDCAIDLPEANVIIQIASHFGARRQEAQRLGRILRPKQRVGDAFNAFFYTLISRDTQEMYYSGKRQQFLVDQGYAFKVITELTDMESAEGLSFGTKKEQQALLATILAKSETEIGSADAAEDAEVSRALGDDAAPGAGAGAGISRKRGSMSDLSGASAMVYAEVQPAAQAAAGQKLRREYEKQQKAAAKARAAMAAEKGR
jgi:DNA excision repair protein ERCC-3